MRKILKTTMLLIFVASLFFGFQGCSSTKPIEKTKLAGYWQLKSLNNENTSEVFKTPVPSLKFNFAENRISGTGGCNSYSSIFVLTDKNEFTAQNPIATMKACFEANKEPQFFAALATPNMTISLKNDDSTLLFSKGRNVILQFEKANEDMQDFTGNVVAKRLTGSWTLSSISGGDIDELFTKKPTMEIAEDGKIIGQGGCNSYRTAYTLAGNIITFKPIASTKMACPNMKGEDLFTSHLASRLQVVVDDNKLSFFNDNVLVLGFTRNNINK